MSSDTITFVIAVRDKVLTVVSYWLPEMTYKMLVNLLYRSESMMFMRTECFEFGANYGFEMRRRGVKGGSNAYMCIRIAVVNRVSMNISSRDKIEFNVRM